MSSLVITISEKLNTAMINMFHTLKYVYPMISDITSELSISSSDELPMSNTMRYTSSITDRRTMYWLVLNATHNIAYTAVTIRVLADAEYIHPDSIPVGWELKLKVMMLLSRTTNTSG